MRAVRSPGFIVFRFHSSRGSRSLAFTPGSWSWISHVHWIWFFLLPLYLSFTGYLLVYLGSCLPLSAFSLRSLAFLMVLPRTARARISFTVFLAPRVRSLRSRIWVIISKFMDICAWFAVRTGSMVLAWFGHSLTVAGFRIFLRMDRGHKHRSSSRSLVLRRSFSRFLRSSRLRLHASSLRALVLVVFQSLVLVFQLDRMLIWNRIIVLSLDLASLDRTFRSAWLPGCTFTPLSASLVLRIAFLDLSGSHSAHWMAHWMFSLSLDRCLDRYSLRSRAFGSLSSFAFRALVRMLAVRLRLHFGSLHSLDGHLVRSLDHAVLHHTALAVFTLTLANTLVCMHV